MGLPISSSLSVLCVEMMPRPDTYVDIPLEFEEALVKENPQQNIAAKQSLANLISSQTANYAVNAQVNDTQESPLGQGLGQYRILRTSPLTPVPFVCCT